MCRQGGRRRRHMRHHRMPTFGVHKSSVAGSPLYKTIAHFGTSHVLRKGYTLDKCASPAGLHPVSDSVTGHLRRLYDELKGPHEKELSRDKFERFLKTVQHDTTPPSWFLSEKTRSFTFEEFLNCWWKEYSAAKRTIHSEDKDLDRPISNYFISSSHNTYIEDGNQFTGEAKALQYKKASAKDSLVLESGCRCVEIDVWDASEADEDTTERPVSLSNTRPGKQSNRRRDSSSHWSFSSMFSWMKDQCTVAAARSMSFPRSLQSKKSEASFNARPPARAKAIHELDDSASVISSLLKREPRVRHAHETYAGDLSLHEAIPFRTVCQTIKNAAFTCGNDLPVIISLEVHANIAQQEKMVKIMREEWGDLLLDEPLPHCHPSEKQPTLRELRNKILIKVKTGSQTAPVPSSTTTKNPSAAARDIDSASSLKPSQSTASSFGTSIGSIKPPKRRICDSLRRLAVYTYSPGHFTTFDVDDAKQPAHVYSFSEEKIKALHRTEHKGLFQHNRHFLARTFPGSFSSVLSSNPNFPTLFWRKGVQMVALNWQVWDTAMELNDAMFDHEQGWVLKPRGYRSSDSEGDNIGSNVKCQADIVGKKMDLTITVLAGQHVPTTDNNDNDTGSSSSSSNEGAKSWNNNNNNNNTRQRMTWAGAARMNLAAVNAQGFCPRVKCFLHVESPAERNARKPISRDDLARKTRVARTEQPDWGVSGSKMHFSGVRHVVEEVSFVR
ncbi:PLC-like phosphodiesterase [Coniella lustricola]|uniref:Phosphoinositide phospholipase C n=1 Tax=Coniella lustricola TaxID=2025994 RepID=A0A2T2ZVS1_9PEZI|nr:PLC-like phosphodiesterase [Coniella lustricola]